MSDPRAQIRDFVIKNFLFGQSDGLADDTSFLESGIIDSTGVLELVAHLESTCAIKVDDTELTPDNLDSVEAIALFVERKRADTAV